jgi:acyl-coenzyme A synthetase/AMP-(fatty) acid ligase
LFPTQESCIIDSAGHQAEDGDAGEFCVGGSQVAAGYWKDPQRTEERFVRIEGAGDAIYYRTGDLVRRDRSGCLYFLGRLDDQVQILGHRVELQEIDHVLRAAAGHTLAVAVAWPMRNGRADAVYAFVVASQDVDTRDLIDRCRGVLPGYMVPRRIFVTEELPVSSSGKIDRRALCDRLGELLRDE